MIKITSDIISDFQKKLRYYSIGSYLDLYFNFYQNNYPVIVQFFSGEISKLDHSNVEILDRLLKQSELIRSSIFTHKNKLNTYKDWEVVEYFENLKLELITTTKISKFLRSSITNFNFNGTLEFNYVAKQHQSLENISGTVLRSPDYDNDWINIAIRNDLSEKDYTTNGSEKLKLSINRKAFNFKIDSVVDNMIGERVYGLDIQKKIEFSDDDLVVLGYKETLFQSADILANLRKGDVPEFLEFGLSNFVGGNVASLGFGSITRQLQKNFSSDDSLIDFTVTNVKLKEDSLFLEYSVSSRLDEMIKSSTQI